MLYNNSIIYDDYSNFKTISLISIISDPQRMVLNEANGLRNRLLYEYNGINDPLLEKSFSNIEPELHVILEALETWIENNLV